MRKILLFVIAVTVAVNCGAATAVYDLILKLKESNLEIAISRKKIEIAKQLSRKSGMYNDPRLVVEQKSIPESGGIFDAVEKNIGLAQFIPFPGKRTADKNISEKELEIVTLENKGTELKVIEGFNEKLADLYYLEKALELYGTLSGVLDTLSEAAQAKFVSGGIRQKDLYDIEIQKDKINLEYDSLLNEKQFVLYSLGVYLNSKETAIEVDFSVYDVFVPFNSSWKEVEKQVLEDNVDIRIASAQTQKMDNLRTFAANNYLPDFDLTVLKKRVNDSWSGTDVVFFMNFPLWYMKQTADYKAADFGYTASNAELDKTKLLVLMQANESYNRIISLNNIITTYKNTILSRSEDSFKLSQNYFLSGKIGYNDMFDSLKYYIETKLEYYRYLTEYKKLNAKLSRLKSSY